jgi:hypothetical protein
MANQLKIIGQAYKNFGLKHTSKSTATLPNSIRFFKKHCLNTKEASKLTNASLQGGTIIHLITQEVKTKNVSIDEAINKKEIQDKINNYEPFNEKDKIKFTFIIKFLKATVQNHLDNIKELPQQKWKDELQYTLWTPPVNTYWLCYVDLIGKAVDEAMKSYFGDLKNKFGSVSFKPLLKNKSKNNEKINENRIGDWVYSAPKIDHHIYSSDLMQIALYKKAVGLKPFISYANHKDRKLFTEDNCEELKQENLDKHLKTLMIYEIAWQKKLEYADGDLKKLAWLCPPDYSDIKKGSFWWDGVPKEYINRYLNYYELGNN